MKKIKSLLLFLLFFVGNFCQQAYATPDPVTGKSGLQIATFDDLPLAPESYWYGDTDGETVFYSGSFSFTNTYTPIYSSWGGFAYSNLTATDFDPSQWLTHQFRSATGAGLDGSANYAVAYISDFTKAEIDVMHNIDEGDTIAGVYLTNAAYALHSALNGDSYMGAPFTHGDYYKIIFTGKNVNGATTSSVECYLMDYRSSQANEHFALTTWEWFDLSSLGKISKVIITVKSSREDQWGSLLPTYFCMDNFGGSKISVSVPSVASKNTCKVYPTATTGLIHIVLPEVITEPIQVFDISGKVLQTIRLQSLESSIDISTYQSGLYFIKIGNQTVKVIKI